MNATIQISLAALLLVACTSFAQDESRTWMAGGIDAYRHARYAEAVRCFEHAVTLDPKSADARVSLALAYLLATSAGANKRSSEIGQSISQARIRPKIIRRDAMPKRISTKRGNSTREIRLRWGTWRSSFLGRR